MDTALALSLEFCPVKDLVLVCGLVCRQWKCASEAANVWRNALERDGYRHRNYQGTWKEQYIWAWRMARNVYFSYRYGNMKTMYRFDLRTSTLSILRCGRHRVRISPMSPSLLYLYSPIKKGRDFACIFYNLETNTDHAASHAVPYQEAVPMHGYMYVLGTCPSGVQLDYYNQALSLSHISFLPVNQVEWTIADYERLYICTGTEIGVYAFPTQQYRKLLANFDYWPEVPIVSCCWTASGDVYVFGGEDSSYLLYTYSPTRNDLQAPTEDLGLRISLATLYSKHTVLISLGRSFKLYILEARVPRRLLSVEL